MKRQRKLMRSLESDSSCDGADSTSPDICRNERRIKALNEVLASKDPAKYLKDLCQKSDQSDENEVHERKKRDLVVTFRSFLRIL